MIKNNNKKKKNVFLKTKNMLKKHAVCIYIFWYTVISKGLKIRNL